MNDHESDLQTVVTSVASISTEMLDICAIYDSLNAADDTTDFPVQLRDARGFEAKCSTLGS